MRRKKGYRKGVNEVAASRGGQVGGVVEHDDKDREWRMRKAAAVKCERGGGAADGRYCARAEPPAPRSILQRFEESLRTEYRHSTTRYILTAALSDGHSAATRKFRSHTKLKKHSVCDGTLSSVSLFA